MGYIRRYSNKLYELSDQMKAKAIAKANQPHPKREDSASKSKRKVSDKRGSHGLQQESEDKQPDVE